MNTSRRTPGKRASEGEAQATRRGGGRRLSTPKCQSSEGDQKPVKSMAPFSVALRLSLVRAIECPVREARQLLDRVRSLLARRENAREIEFFELGND